MVLEDIIDKSKKIERILSELGAEGKGLHQKLDSIEDRIDEQIAREIRFIATIRNKRMHEDGFDIDEYTEAKFNRAYEHIVDNIGRKEQINKNGPGETKSLSFWEKVGIGIAAVAVLVFFKDR